MNLKHIMLVAYSSADDRMCLDLLSSLLDLRSRLGSPKIVTGYHGR
jgi:hypothetical protein